MWSLQLKYKLDRTEETLHREQNGVVGRTDDREMAGAEATPLLYVFAFVPEFMYNMIFALCCKRGL